MRVVLMVAAVGLVACGDLQFVAPGVLQPALSIFASARYDSQSNVTVSANMFPGRDADGHPAAFSDSAMYINGKRVAPVVVDDSPYGSRLSYEWNVDHALTASAESLLVVGPTLRSGGAVQSLVVVPTRIDPRDITLTAGVDLRLHVTTAAALQLADSLARFWDLTLAMNCTQGPPLLRLSANAAWPAELRVPWEQLPGTRPTTIEACFRGGVFYGAGLYSPYRTGISVTTIAQWTIQLQP